MTVELQAVTPSACYISPFLKKNKTKQKKLSSSSLISLYLARKLAISDPEDYVISFQKDSVLAVLEHHISFANESQKNSLSLTVFS